MSTKHTVDPYVEVSLHVPDWSHAAFPPGQSSPHSLPKQESGGSSNNASGVRTISRATSVVKNNGFNPVWQQTVSIPFDCVGDMKDLIFVRFQVKDEYDGTYLAVYCISLGSLMPGTMSVVTKGC
jgi:phosphatidylinositol phospholipase C, delta